MSCLFEYFYSLRALFVIISYSKIHMSQMKADRRAIFVVEENAGPVLHDLSEYEPKT